MKNFKKTVTIFFLLFSISLGGCLKKTEITNKTFHSERAYLKSMLEQDPIGDPRMAYLLMSQYLNSNQFNAGIQFFTSIINNNKANLKPPHKGIYLSIIGVLRAKYIDQVPLLEKIAWIKETIEILDKAKKLTGGKIYPVRWIRGVVFSQLPERFDKREESLKELKWCMENDNKAPDHGYLREVYFSLARIYKDSGNDKKAANYLKLSRYKNYDKEITLVTPYSIESKTGFYFSKKEIKEIVPGKIFLISGVEFTEHYFILSENGKELIAIDAGTRPDSAKEAYEYLKKHFPHLPEVTTIFFTHAHWDHIGGYKFYKNLNPKVKFYSRDNYYKELALTARAPRGFHYFVGSDFKMENIVNFKPDITISKKTSVNIGGANFELIPIPGGETVDGMIIHLPHYKVTFVGDFIMPYIGAPFLNEGNPEGLFQTIDIIVALKPKFILHGHERLTYFFKSTRLLLAMKPNLQWLYNETRSLITAGLSREMIHHENLIPPDFNQPGVYIPYLLLRENLINRVFDQQTGYWHADLKGMDHISNKELGALMVHYMNLKENDLAEGISKMVKAGDYELAKRAVTWSLTQFPESKKLLGLERKVYLKLIEKYQVINPFKFIIYSEKIGMETRVLPNKLKQEVNPNGH